MQASRREIEDKIDGLRRERGAAVLDGGKFDPAALVSAEAELGAVDDAEAEQVRRDRKAAASAHAETLAERRKTLVAAWAERLGMIADKEKYTRALAAVQAMEQSKNVIIRKLMHELTGDVPLPFHQNEIDRRQSAQMSSVMSTVPGHKFRWGYIEWAGAGLHRPDDDWTKAEAAIAARYINPLMKED